MTGNSNKGHYTYYETYIDSLLRAQGLQNPKSSCLLESWNYVTIFSGVSVNNKSIVIHILKTIALLLSSRMSADQSQRLTLGKVSLMELWGPRTPDLAVPWSPGTMRCSGAVLSYRTLGRKLYIVGVILSQIRGFIYLGPLKTFVLPVECLQQETGLLNSVESDNHSYNIRDNQLYTCVLWSVRTNTSLLMSSLMAADR